MNCIFLILSTSGGIKLLRCEGSHCLMYPQNIHTSPAQPSRPFWSSSSGTTRQRMPPKWGICQQQSQYILCWICGHRGISASPSSDVLEDFWRLEVSEVLGVLWGTNAQNSAQRNTAWVSHPIWKFQPFMDNSVLLHSNGSKGAWWSASSSETPHILLPDVGLGFGYLVCTVRSHKRMFTECTVYTP